MARFLLCTIPAIGHVNPVLPIARQLVERGHEVCWYTGKGFQPQVEATGTSFVPIKAGIDLSDPQTIPKSLIEAQSFLKGIRVQWARVGINLKTKTPTPKQVKDAVKTILTSSHYRQKAQHFQAEIARYNAPTMLLSYLKS